MQPNRQPAPLKSKPSSDEVIRFMRDPPLAGFLRATDRIYL